MKKISLSIFIMLSLCVNSFSFFENDFIYALNPDPYSQAVGSSILSLSPSVFGSYNNPATNYTNISNELEISYASIYNNIYGGNIGFIIPTSKSGNFSFIVSRYDYNKDTSVTNYNNTTMIMLNYVYPLNKQYPIFSQKGAIGLNLKYYYLSMQDKDVSANLFSGDIGFIYSLDFIDKDLTGALAVKNLGNNIEYTVDDEQLSFKQRSNAVASLRYLLNEDIQLAVMADIIKFFEIENVGMAGGLELSPVYPLTLRVGWRDHKDNFNKGITAGLSLNFDRVNLAYSYSDIIHTDDDQHIFSLGVFFGNVANSNKAYEHYLNYYIQKAKQEYTNGNYISAKQQFEDIVAVYPDSAIARKYLEILDREIYLSDKQQKEKIDKYLAKADSAILNKNYIKAQSYYSKILLIDNKNVYAKRGLEEIKVYMEEQKAYENRKKHADEIAQYWLEAQDHMNKNELVYAKDKFNKILEIDPTNTGALQQVEFINKKLQKVSKTQVDDLFNKGLAKYNAGQYEDALKFFNAAYISDKTRTDIKNYVDKCSVYVQKENKNKKQKKLKTNKQIEIEMKSVYDKGIEEFNTNSYKEALSTFTKLENMASEYKYYSYNESIEYYKKQCNMKLSKQYFDKAKDCEIKSNDEEAYKYYELVLKYDSKNEDAQASYNKVKNSLAKKYYEQALESYFNGNKEKTIKLLDKSLQYDNNEKTRKFKKQVENR